MAFFFFLGRQEEVSATTPRREEGKFRAALAATKIKQREANTRLPAELHQHRISPPAAEDGATD